MKKSLLIIAGIALMLASCEKATFSESGDIEENAPTKKFTFHVKGDFKTMYSDMTRAAVRLEDDNSAGITDIWVLDYVDGTLAQQVHQTSSDADFGHPSMNLTYGSHDVKFVASKGENPSLTASGISWTKVKDTFVLDYPIDVAASSNGNRAPELKRAISGLQIAMTDAVPENATAVKVKLSKHYKSLLLSSLFGETSEEYENTFSFTSANVGQKINLNTYTLCPSSEVWQTDVTVTAIGANSATLSTFTIQNVELKQNRITALKGEVFSRGSGFSVTINDAWDEQNEVEF